MRVEGVCVHDSGLVVIWGLYESFSFLFLFWRVVVCCAVESCHSVRRLVAKLICAYL